jgi:MFS family permease
MQSLPATYWYLWLGTLLNKIGWLVVPFLTIYLTEVRHLPVSQATLSAALVGLGSLLFSPVGGLFADQFGRRKTLLLSLSLTAVATLVLGLVHEFWLISVIAFLLGGFSALYAPAASAMIADVVEQPERGHAYGLQYWATNVGMALAPLLAGVIASQSSLALFLIDALTTAIFGVLVWLRVPETRPRMSDPPSKEHVRHNWKGVRGEPLFLVLTLLSFGFACIWFQGYATLPLDMRAHGLTTTQYGLAIALNGLVVVALSLPISALVTRLPRSYVLAGATLLLGIGFGLTALVSTLPLYALTVAIWTFGEIAAVPLMTTIVADLSPSHLRGRFQGVYGVAWGLASFLGPTLGGIIVEHMGTRVLWLGCFLLALLLTLSYLALARPMRLRLEHQS